MHMARSATEVLSHFQKVTGASGHHAKKEALFDTIHGMVTADVAAAKAAGATDAMLAPFTETLGHLAAHKAQIVGMDLS
jgi:hypothetical protein